MHIHDIIAAADYRMVEGRDWLWDWLGRGCREVLFESWGLHDSDEHFPVSAVFHCETGAVRQVTIETATGAWRWMDAECHAGYVLACADLGEKPWCEPGLTWLSDGSEIVAMIAAALHPERRPDDADESYRWEGSDLQGVTDQDQQGRVQINP